MRYFVFSILFIFFACSSDDYKNYNNPYLNPHTVNLELNLNLPQYNSLKYPGNSVKVYHQGIRGIVIFCVNDSYYTAYELSDPNHYPNNCSTMEVEGIIASCPCPEDDNSYDIVTGIHKTQDDMYPMLGYRVQRKGDVIRVFN